MPSLRRTPKPAPSKARSQTKAAPAKPTRRQRARQIKTAFDLTRENDPRLLPMLLSAVLGPLVLLLALGFVLGHPVFFGILGLLIGLVAGVAVFGRRMQKMQYSQV